MLFSPPCRVPLLRALLPIALLLLSLPQTRARADAFTDKLTALAAAQVVPVPLDQWKFHQPDIPGGEAVTLDDSAWQTVAPGFTWTGENTNVWFRTRYVVPETINGIPTRGTALKLDMGMDDDGQVYVNGKFLLKFTWDAGQMTLTEHAQPGQVFLLAVRGINGPGAGSLRHARLVYDLLAPLARYAQEAQFVDGIAAQMPTAQQAQTRATLQESEGQVDLAALQAKDYAKGGASVTTARATLLTLAPITRQYDVYYVGHAHIDMNWLWTWPETIDVCHRTWDSALHLMDLYPDFGFVQSQPGAYRAIQQQFPAEFVQMQQAQKRGQWDTVGGLYDESDTNIPSGEGLARSLFLGQRFFKTNFGRYATTGWLPDSFGHSWQLPQLMRGAGLENFYHTRCGDGVRYAWWQAPDGSRVLKANTDSYDDPVTTENLVRPWQIERQNGLKEALVVFGVGDHGGGPTREMIEQGQEFAADPLFPHVHFLTADAYFQHLRSLPQTATLPVLDTDLQYVFVGCYTTHADLKKALRQSENNLYAGEVYSSLAAMSGHPYPVQGFTEAWKPTAFAQFHDIACGSAIHSTYDWMHAQLAPAFAFEQAQTSKALAALTLGADTRGGRAGEQAVVVWNPLSFARTDAVRLTVPDAARYAQVRDGAGRVTPVQALDAHTLAFVAADVPALGHKTYFLLSAAASTPAMTLARETPAGLALENSFLRATIAKDTGLITSLYDKKASRELVPPGQTINGLQMLGDSGNAWDISYTGEQHPLTTGADVRLVASGPVCAVVRVTHVFGHSTFTQDLTLWNNLPRLDVPTMVDWHELGQLLKVAFPLAMQHPTARVGIPYGSIERPTTGQENPGQKWMDVSESEMGTVREAIPLDLSKLLNQKSSGDFDTQKRSYPATGMPAAGIHTYGAAQIPFRLAGPGALDNVACAGQSLAVPPGTRGGATLYLLGASALGAQGGLLTLVRADGSRDSLPFTLGDWVVGGGKRDEDALTLEARLSETGAVDSVDKPHLWITSVPVPPGSPVTRIILPHSPDAHVFALTLADAPEKKALYGLSVLNDCKYGSDTTGSTFRLTLLRSSHDPDPNPDEGVQTFTYSLLPHAGDWRTARSEQAGLSLNVPLSAVLTGSHPGQAAPQIALLPSDNLVVGALKHAEDGPGYVLRLFETQGRDTVAQLTFSSPVRVQETDLLERPIQKRKITVEGRAVSFPVGHDQIVTLHVSGLPDAGADPVGQEPHTARLP